MTQRNAPMEGSYRRLLMWLMHRYFAFSRGMTLGVRAACYNDKGEIFLVRHSYLPGWYMPGGGVERGETLPNALEKEIREEGNLVLTAPAELVHVYLNTKASPRDHVVFYKAKVKQTAPRPRDWEIVECGFFDPENLPDGTSASTRRRLEELSGLLPHDDFW
ncbi:NUDIX domain-containing protein [Rhizobium halophytocola]|uniref:ADP-ribose pyrophosphatase YjhB (NUDIX family) n=1 Tax=Rhizobium halophytocola TaxID=735519 RepID=A0ABS4E3R8_9HYPH|nr:NUDIX domain-containing protein [Rhizobium halophytocola]MBP1852561.1 ADP-ribose pyrophosphatase YjhB (NUDIX family) [Rhizobium halophytocola]